VKEASKVGLKVNEKQTKIMTINSKNNSSILLSQTALEGVDQFYYLRSTLSDSGYINIEVKIRIGKATATFN